MLMKELKGKTMIVTAGEFDNTVNDLVDYESGVIDTAGRLDLCSEDNFYMVIEIPLLRQDKTKVNRFNEALEDVDNDYDAIFDLHITDIVAGLAARGIIPEGVDNLLIQG